MELKKLVSSRYTFDRMANACGVNKTYLSRVLNHDTHHLNDDQLFQAASFLGLSSFDTEYLSLLLAHERTADSSRRSMLKKQITVHREKKLKTENYIHSDGQTTEVNELDIYGDPDVMLTLTFLAVDRFRQDVGKIAEKLEITAERMTTILSKLERCGLIRLHNGTYESTKRSTHLSKDSAAYGPYRFMQRVRGLERTRKIREHSYCFSGSFTATSKAVEEIHRSILDMLAKAQATAADSADDDVYQLNIDLFDWSVH